MNVTKLRNDEIGAAGVQGVGAQGCTRLPEARQRHGIAMSFGVPATLRLSGDESQR